MEQHHVTTAALLSSVVKERRHSGEVRVGEQHSGLTNDWIHIDKYGPGQGNTTEKADTGPIAQR